MREKQVASRKISKEEWFDYIKQCESGQKSQAEFCSENGLSETLFEYWRTRYLKQKKLTSCLAQGTPLVSKKPLFIPVKLSESATKTNDVIQARFHSGLILSLPLSMPTAQIVELVKALESSHAD